MLHSEAKKLATLLADQKVRIVLAESCTAGLASAILAQNPGISQWHCGSAVTYREATKQAWLDVAASDLKQFSAVSEPVAVQMALGVLEKTPEADFAASITGHLGPDAPESLEGVVFVAIAQRANSATELRGMRRIELQATQRADRQNEAAATMLHILSESIEADR